MAKQVPLREVKQREYFTLSLTSEEQEETKEVNPRKVWVRECYDRRSKKYWAYRFNDINHYNTFSGDKLVWTDLYF